jgi:hypothetical protein
VPFPLTHNYLSPILTSHNNSSFNPLYVAGKA